jgi:hypothetical protein
VRIGPLSIGPLVAALALDAIAVHPEIAKAIEAYEGASFEDALEILNRAEAGSDLSRDDVLELLRRRVLVRFAMGDRAGMDADLVRLVSIDPDHVFGEDAPPPVSAALAVVKARPVDPISITVVVERPAPGRVALAPKVIADPGGVVRSTRLYVRSPDAAYAEAPAPAVLETNDVEYYAEAIGIGGAVVAARGAPGAPLRFSAPAEATLATAAEDGGVDPLWYVAGAGAVVVVTAVVLAVVLTRGSSDETQLGAPMVVP